MVLFFSKECEKGSQIFISDRKLCKTFSNIEKDD